MRERVFPGGVGPESPSRDEPAVFLRSSAVLLRRGGGLVCGGCDGVHPVRLFPSANLVSFGVRWQSRGGKRDTVRESLIGRHSTRKRSVARSIGRGG